MPLHRHLIFNLVPLFATDPHFFKVRTNRNVLPRCRTGGWREDPADEERTGG
jgi:hypothetical protein